MTGRGRAITIFAFLITNTKQLIVLTSFESDAHLTPP